MLIIKPIQTKEEQESLSDLCQAEFYPDALAYRAYDDEVPLGICQFRLAAGHGVLCNLTPVPGKPDMEALFIMARATLNFIDLCGLHSCTADKSAGDGALLHAIGFREQKDGTLFMDLTGQFDGHCHERKDETTKP